MANSNDSGSDEDYILYKNRDEWKDIKPIKQNDGPHTVVKIAYDEMFEDVYDYFRAIVAMGELSERALTLTEDAINMNAANYTVWQYRRKIIKHIKYDLEKELDFCRDMIEMNPKNYQVWHHRRVIVEWLGDPSKELRLTRLIFSADAKNYHAWEHRQWVLKTFGLFEKELEYIDELLAEDIRNNSAWNQRYFVVCNTTGFSEPIIEREIKYTVQAINKLANNESSWSYLKGILMHSNKRLSEYQDLEELCLRLIESEYSSPTFAITFLIDILEDKMEAQSEPNQELLNQAVKLCESLEQKHDRIRKEYWKYTARRLTAKSAA